MSENMPQPDLEQDLVKQPNTIDQETAVHHQDVNSEELANRIILLHEIASELNRTRTIEETFELAARMMSRMFKANRASVTLLTTAGDQFSVTALHGENGAFTTDTKFPVEGTLIGTCIQQGQLLNTSDINLVKDMPDALGLFHQGLKSVISAPLITVEKVIGTLNLASSDVNAFSKEDEALLTTIATFLSTTIYNQQLSQIFRKQAKREALVNEISQKIQNTSTIDAALQVTVRELGKALQSNQTQIELKILQD